MSEKVSAFWPVQIGRFKYLFFLVNWSEFSNTISDSLKRNLEVLGQEIGLAGKTVQAYEGARRETFEEVKKKENWPYDVCARFDSEPYPFMLIINTDFDKFHPQEDKWAVVWFSDFRDHPDSVSETFSTLVRKIQRDVNLFDYFKGLAAKKAAKGLIGYFEMKPGAFGFSVDVKAILKDLGKFMRRFRK